MEISIAWAAFLSQEEDEPQGKESIKGLFFLPSFLIQTRSEEKGKGKAILNGCMYIPYMILLERTTRIISPVFLSLSFY
jgi:hypothetical protein